MIDKKIDSTGNLVLSGGTFATVSDDTQIEQHWRIRLAHIKGEWFLNPASGVDLFGKVLARPVNIRAAERECRRITLATPGIAKITKLTVTPNYSTKILSVSIAAVTENAAALYFDQEFAF